MLFQSELCTRLKELKFIKKCRKNSEVIVLENYFQIFSQYERNSSFGNNAVKSYLKTVQKKKNTFPL